MTHHWTMKAEAALVTTEAEALLEALCDHMVEHAEVTREGGFASISLDFGYSAMRLDGDRIHVSVEADDDTSLAFMKLVFADHVVELANSTPPAILWKGDGCATTVPPFFREMRVTGTRQVTPRMRRITLQGADLSRFAEGGLHLRLLFPPKGRVPSWPDLGPDGRLRMPVGEDALEHRIYTIRRIDVASGEMDIDMVLHEGENMPGSDFAENAGVGDLVGITGPGGGFVPDATELFLFGDETALPAISRILESVAPGVRARVFVEVADEGERQELSSPGSFAVEWLARGKDHREGERLVEAVRAHVGPHDADAFVWAAGEHSAFKAIRAYLRKDLGRDRHDHLVSAYWRRGVRGDGTREA
ncbi:siderophore-interacting protein [Aureimonas psammosilenae]|uniref:siderophore-interacting protein n=1 Tax=Aureimonas psammosilenae TaxID=2495496 RepID=UPI0012607DBC|nr:siderophore-interacting protein [Aureimonas psammosilenae]